MAGVLSKFARVCGNALRCGHKCSEDANRDHICVCNQKWTYDPGCEHLLTGTCGEFSNLRLVCTEVCGKVLDCGHSCKERCSSSHMEHHGTFCSTCIDDNPSSDNEKYKNSKNPIDNKRPADASFDIDEDNTGTSLVKRFKELTTEDSELNLRPNVTKQALKRSNPTPKFVRTESPVPTKVAKLMCKGFPDQDTAARKNGDPKPCYFNMPAEEQGPETGYGNSFRVRSSMNISAGPQPANNLQEHLMDQGQSQLFQDIENKPNASNIAYVQLFKTCFNKHVFRSELSSCPVCGGPAEGPDVTVLTNNSEAPETPDTKPKSEMVTAEWANVAWEFGLAKCLNNHYYKASQRQCPACGKPSTIQLPNQCYSDLG